MVKVSIGINSELTFKEDFQKFKKELLDETSKNGKITLQENTPKDTGAGAKAYKIKKSDNQHIISNDTEYLPWVNDGTGIYGPRRQRITPKTKESLHFHWRGREWYLKSVRGQRPQRFVEVSMIEIERSVPQAVMIASRHLK
jgi:hypothetical protein